MMQVEAIITDIDGTAVDSPSQKLASERLAGAVLSLEETGVKVCAATGRSESFAMPVFESMGLTHPAIINGGTRIIDPVTSKELWRCGLSRHQMEEVIEALKEFDYGYIWNNYTEKDYLDGGSKLADFKNYDDTYFFAPVFVPSAEASGVVEVLSSIEGIAITLVVAQRPNTNDIHVTNAAATKEHAIYELEKMIGVDKDAMIGVGDGHNDLHIFKAVGYKVAMGNAVAELKQAADEIIGSVQDDGLAVYFEQLAKGEKHEV